MKKDNEKRLMIIFGILGEVLIIWLSLLIAPTLGGGLPQMIPKLADAFAHPFFFSWSEKTIPCILLHVRSDPRGREDYHGLCGGADRAVP